MPRAGKGDTIATAHEPPFDTMKLRSWPAVLALLGAAVSAQQPAAPAASAVAPVKSAASACEDAVAETVRRMRGRAVQEVQFIGEKRALSAMSDDETGVKGAGRWRGAGGTVPFTYTCAYNTKTGETSGAMFRETGAARERTARTEPAWQPDLTNLSPEACESATVKALKAKYPRVGRIAFGSDSRTLSPAGDGRTQLEGQGAVARAPGMNAIPFSYRCEFDTRSGRVLSARTVEQGMGERAGAGD